VKRVGAVALLLLFWVVPASADEFGSVVKGIEAHYRVRRIHPHLIGFVLFFAKPVTWGSGVGGLKVAVFEDEGKPFQPSSQDVDRILATSLGPKWRPFVRVHSRRDNEETVMYASFKGKKMQMLIASVEAREIVVVRLRLKSKAIRRWVADPTNEAQSASHKH
jgi:hypothetical protein